jgi:PIN domain nuclease of toxin-antitoxin system
MKYLIDTHILLWYFMDAPQLSALVKEIIDKNTNSVFYSIASIWEITIKYSMGKLSVVNGLEELFEVIEHSNFIQLPIEFTHLSTLNTLPFHHKDPFDRLLIAQSISDKLTIISNDHQFKNYSIEMVTL